MQKQKPIGKNEIGLKIANNLRCCSSKIHDFRISYSFIVLMFLFSSSFSFSKILYIVFSFSFSFSYQKTIISISYKHSLAIYLHKSNYKFCVNCPLLF